MFSTAKEVHVYMDGATQSLSSNRKQSIHPQLVDMILNNAVIEYISSKFPEGSNGKDIEATLKRYTDFSILKASQSDIPFLSDDGYTYASIVRPFNALKIQDVSCSFVRPFGNSDIGIENRFIGTISINDNVYKETSLSIGITYSPDGISSISHTIDLTNIIKDVHSVEGMFYFYTSLVDILRNTYNLNVEYYSLSTNGKRDIIIYAPLTGSISDLTCSSNMVICTIESKKFSTSIYRTSRTVPTSVMSDFEARNTINDYYGKKNLYLNPICILEGKNVSVLYTDFLPTKINVYYLRKPKLFNIATGQIPEIDISSGFLDFAVKRMHLILSSPDYEKVLNESSRNL